MSAPATNEYLIPTELGFELIADPGDYVSKLLVRDRIYEVPETDLVTRILLPGDTCIDAGCHIGYYSCLFSRLVGPRGIVYSFDANPRACVNTRRNLRLNGFSDRHVIHAALADAPGTLSFHISTDDQTGLSSLGPIPTSDEIISVPALALGAFIRERHVKAVRLLKIDVEGAEEILLRGLGSVLLDHVIDYVLVECFDERLQLLNTSTEKVAHILVSAGYVPWEYGVEATAGWSQPSEVHSRGDCNYLFSSPSVSADMGRITLAGALHWTQVQKEEKERMLEAARQQWQADVSKASADLQKLQSDIDWLLEAIKNHEQRTAELAGAKEYLEAVLGQIQNSTGWRILNRWRKLRNRLAPEDSWHRRLYESMLRTVRGQQ